MRLVGETDGGRDIGKRSADEKHRSSPLDAELSQQLEVSVSAIRRSSEHCTTW
jgi:hypothetical protein